MSNQEAKVEEQSCVRCGRPAAIRVGDEFYCEECYQIAGSCCPEFGGEDIWEVDEESPGPKQSDGGEREGESGS